MEKERKIKRYIYLLSFYTTLLYIIYRILFTIPNDTFVTVLFAIIVLLVETIDAFFYAIYVFNILVFNKSNPTTPLIRNRNFPDVDVFIATINEEKDLLKETILACKKMKYPDKEKVHIYICDDGNRKEIKNLTEELNVNYITRNNNINSKAGNYNNALTKTNSPYIVTFDADMKPKENFLLKTIPFLIKDKTIGFVQLPQCFDDLDLFQTTFKLNGIIPYEQDYFYHTIQIAKNKTNSVIYCGTNTVISRKALMKTNGFATQTITEDIATGMLIESNGYKGFAINDDLVYGINVKNTESLLKQRSRWCRGCIQTLKNYKIIKNKNLTLRQQLDYLSCIYYWSFGIRTIFYLLVPLLFSLFDISIIQTNIYLFLLLFFIQFFLKRFVVDILENNKISSTWNRIYEIILSPIIFYESIKELIGLGNLKFEVTQKKNDNKKIPIKSTISYIIHLSLFLLTTYGIIVSLYKGYILGFKDYIIPLFWLITNLFYLLMALIFDTTQKKERIESPKEAKKYHFFSIPVLLFKYLIKGFKTSGIITLMIIISVTYSMAINVDKLKVPYVNHNLVSYNKELNVKNGLLVNEKDELVQLRGVSTHNLYWYKDNYKYDNIKELVNTWGINVLRVALYTSEEEEGYIKNKYLINNVKELINYAIELDIYVIIDWHILNDNNPQIYKKEALDFFNEISLEYNRIPNVIYEICNEPNGDDVTWDKDIKPYAEEVIDVIRKNSPASLILVGTANWSKDIESVRYNRINESNIMYVVHAYPEGGLDIIHSGIENAKKEKIPIIVTECAATDPTGNSKLYKDIFKQEISYFEDSNISWIVWQFSDKDEASSLLISKEKKWKKELENNEIDYNEITNTYNINNYLSEEGKLVKSLISEYSNKTKIKGH